VEDASGLSRIVGLRAASLALGIGKSLLYREIQKINEAKNNHLLPQRALVKGQGGSQAWAYTWPNAVELVAWWEKVRAKAPGTLPALLGVEETTTPVDGHEVMIEALLDQGTVEALRAIGKEHDIPVKEILVLTVALGLANWDL
jgi:hypothetical protein